MEEPKTTVKTNMYEQMMYPPVKGPPRALQARPNTLQHPLLRPLHSQLYIQQHSLPQPLYPWLRAQALLACLTQPMEWNHSLLSYLWHLRSANPWPLARPTLVSTSRPLVLNLVPTLGPLLVFALLQCLAIPCQSPALLPSAACEALSLVEDKARGLEDLLTNRLRVLS